MTDLNADSKGVLGMEVHSLPDPKASDHTHKRRPWRRAVVSWNDILSHPYPGQGTEASPFVVNWLPGDVENPKTFSLTFKWVATMIAATATLAVSMGSSLLSAAIPSIVIMFPGRSSFVYIMVTSAYVLGFVVGPLFWAPCSEVYGRRTMFVITYIPFTIFNAAVSGCTNLGGMLFLRFMAGTWGSSAMTNSGGMIADMFETHQRGLALGMFAVAPFMGPAIGPVAGGFLSESRGWQWAAAVIAIFAFAITITGFVWLPETYAPVLLRRRAALLSKTTGMVYRTQQDLTTPLTPRRLFLGQLKKPWALFFLEPIVLLAGIYLAIVYAILYMQFTAFPIVFQQNRHWSSGISGLAFCGVTVGALSAIGYIMVYENPRYAKLSAKNGGYVIPEERLKSVCIGAILLPIGLFIFAWTAVPIKIHWIIPLGSTVPYGMGIVLLFLGISNYLVDTYLLYAASVLAGGTVVRSVFGVLLPLGTTVIYQRLGVNWAGTLVAMLSLVFSPVPFIFLKYGARIRSLSEAAMEAENLAKLMRARMAAEAQPLQVATISQVDKDGLPDLKQSQEHQDRHGSVHAREEFAEVESEMMRAAAQEGGQNAVVSHLTRCETETGTSRTIEEV